MRLGAPLRASPVSVLEWHDVHFWSASSCANAGTVAVAQSDVVTPCVVHPNRSTAATKPTARRKRGMDLTKGSSGDCMVGSISMCEWIPAQTSVGASVPVQNRVEVFQPRALVD